jgi:aldehyde dehydrogenase (NAD+)
VQARCELLDRIGSEILGRADELANLLAREEGKALRDAAAEVRRAGQIFKFFSGEVLRIRGERLASVREGVQVDITREPVGVVTVITPWNFPIAIPAWKIAPALAYGNCVVFKPAELTPGSAWALADIIHRAGAPPGVFNFVNGRGSVIGSILTGEGVDAVSFTGSTGVGHGILQVAAERQVKVQLEMGGKNPLVVLADADLDVAVRAALDGAFLSTGQRCTASSRLIVQDQIHDPFVSALQEAMARQVVDDARAPNTTIGPVVDAKQLQTDIDYIELGLREGATLAHGGRKLTRAKEGHYLEPALFIEATAQMRVCREEIFGPVATVIRARDYDEALALANDTPFGLSAGICTTSLRYAEDFKRNAAAGMVMVNLPTAGVDYHVPFGGRKASSLGPREQGAYAAEFYTNVKTAYVNAA